MAARKFLSATIVVQLLFVCEIVAGLRNHKNITLIRVVLLEIFHTGNGQRKSEHTEESSIRFFLVMPKLCEPIRSGASGENCRKKRKEDSRHAAHLLPNVVYATGSGSIKWGFDCG